jgi:hypothetical protein
VFASDGRRDLGGQEPGQRHHPGLMRLGSTRGHVAEALLGARTLTVRSVVSGASTTGHSELKLCVLRARRVRGLATSGSGLTA